MDANKNIKKIVEIQRAMRKELLVCINGKMPSRSEEIASLLFSNFVYSKFTARLIRLHSEFISKISGNNSTKSCVRIDCYNGANQAVRKMADYLYENLKEDLVGAYIHGSLGTYEEEAYSDFDALVIVRDEVFNSQKRLSYVCKKLRNALGIMYEYDPLQHHGWFALIESELQCYDKQYFPVVLFQYSKSLFVHSGRELQINLNETGEKGNQGFSQIDE